MNKKTEKNLETPAIATPIVLAVGAVALAGAGYLVWNRRSKIKKFIKDQNLGETFGELTDKAADLLDKPTTGKLHYASESKSPATK